MFPSKSSSIELANSSKMSSSSNQELPPLPASANDGGHNKTWDVESIFNPPKHDFGSGLDNEPRRKTPPRFLGKKKRNTSGGIKNAGGALEEGNDAKKLKEDNAAAAAGATYTLHSRSFSVDQESFPIKFSLSHDYKDDASFTEYLKESGIVGSSPGGSPTLGSFGLFAPSPPYVQGAETFDYDNNNGGFPIPKLQMSPLYASNTENCSSTNDKQTDPLPTMPKPSEGGAAGLPPPRFPIELIHSREHEPIVSTHAGPTQHQSPGQTIYNVPSKSVDSPPYIQPYPWQPHFSHPSASSDSLHMLGPLVSEEKETSPEFNPPRSHLRGESRANATTITVTAQNSHDSGAGNETQVHKEPITPSSSQIRQAVSDESSSPRFAPTVHHPPSSAGHTPTTVGTPTSGGWPDSLHMAPPPPYVAHHQGWGPYGPPAMPSGSGYPHSAPYYSPYYQQHHHHQAVPDRAPSSSTAYAGGETVTWSKHHHLLDQFLHQFGHCNIPQGYGVGTPYEGLYQWCNEQRSQYQLMCRINSDGGGETHHEKCTMTPTRARILTNMGFVWGQPLSGFRPSAPHSSSDVVSTGKHNSNWEKWMELLSDYHAQHGNVDVPLKYELNPSLGTFVNRQRTEYRKMQSGKPSTMTPAKIDNLNRLGFTWAVRESHVSWEDRFAELKVFFDENGHCNVPKIYGKNPSLGYWVNEQRFQYRRLMKKKPSYMTQEKLKALNELDFKVGYNCCII